MFNNSSGKGRKNSRRTPFLPPTSSSQSRNLRNEFLLNSQDLTPSPPFPHNHNNQNDVLDDSNSSLFFFDNDHNSSPDSQTITYPHSVINNAPYSVNTNYRPQSNQNNNNNNNNVAYYHDKKLPSTNELELSNLTNTDSSTSDDLRQKSQRNDNDAYYHENYNLVPLPSVPHQSPFEDLELNDPNTPNNINDDNQQFLNHNNTNQNNIDSDPSSKQKFHFFEKERLRILRQKPRFHYTNLPYFTILVTLLQVIVFIVELARMSILTGSAFQTQPYFNPMLGPSTYLLINMGARYVPCMQQIQNITDDTTIQFPCANSTTVETNVCSLSQLCGLQPIPMVNNAFIPDQWYRIITPIFLHAGFLHIIFNLLLQITMGPSIERSIGFIKFALIYIASGISGFLLGANFTPEGIASTGASGALFGIVATNILLFVYCGKKNTNIYNTRHYGLFILIMVGEIIVSLVLGLLPGMDNFSHIGGFAMGILMAVLLCNDPFFVYEDGLIPYNSKLTQWQHFKNQWNPKAFWDYKIPMKFMIWLTVRVIALILIIVYFVFLVKNFFTGKDGPGSSSTCHWCKYINCIPVHGWCDIGQVSVTTTTTPVTSAAPSGSQATNQAVETSASEVLITTTLPSSIENTSSPDDDDGSNNKRQEYVRVRNGEYEVMQQFGIFEDPTPPPSIKQLDPSTNQAFVNNQGVGIAFYAVLFLLTIAFIKKSKRHDH
ncbi:hypothetical protein DFJ63DRAFT_313007 [Scheffersomyces coipomensis]|uniref:uncharacterized protein n=1 Tax=Scheffersomyces coipomensis TaxID=1788519 RepID=UPI00315DA886